MADNPIDKPLVGELGVGPGGKAVVAGQIFGGVHVHYATGHPPNLDQPPLTVVHLPQRPPLVIGREQEIEELRHRLQEPGSVAYVAGLAGRGKTTLTLEYAHRYQGDFEAVHWLPCQRRTLVQMAGELAWQLGLKLDGELDSVVRQLTSHCASKRCLLVLDNVEDDTSARLMPGGRTSVLITTRLTNLRFLRGYQGLQASYGSQALILKAWGRLDEAMALHKKQEVICLELGNEDGLQTSFGNQAVILQHWGLLEEAMVLQKKGEGIALELGDLDSLQASYGNQALILQAWGRLDEAMALLKKQEAICLKLGNQEGLQACYGNQALILQTWRRLDEAMTLLKKVEAISLELGHQVSLAHCYWNWGLLAREQSDSKTEREKLERALALFTELKMPREIEAVQKSLDETNGNSPGN